MCISVIAVGLVILLFQVMQIYKVYHLGGDYQHHAHDQQDELELEYPVEGDLEHSRDRLVDVLVAYEEGVKVVGGFQIDRGDQVKARSYGQDQSQPVGVIPGVAAVNDRHTHQQQQRDARKYEHTDADKLGVLVYALRRRRPRELIQHHDVEAALNLGLGGLDSVVQQLIVLFVLLDAVFLGVLVDVVGDALLDLGEVVVHRGLGRGLVGEVVEGLLEQLVGGGVELLLVQRVSVDLHRDAGGVGQGLKVGTQLVIDGVGDVLGVHGLVVDLRIQQGAVDEDAGLHQYHEYGHKQRQHRHRREVVKLFHCSGTSTSFHSRSTISQRQARRYSLMPSLPLFQQVNMVRRSPWSGSCLM